VVEDILKELDQSSGKKGVSIKALLAVNAECERIKDAANKIDDAYKYLMVSCA
jgi:hypothetical protein